jgi:hypothetical protein
MRTARLVGSCAVLALGVAGCSGRSESVVPSAKVADTAVHAPDSIPEERPDSIKSLPPDSSTMLLAMLPAAPDSPLSAEAAAIADRAVFPPLTQRWFMARMVDSALAVDVGRIDGGVGTTDAARAAFEQVIAAHSPVQRGMSFTAHLHAGARAVTVTGFRVSGRRIVALLDAPATDSADRAVPVEWRGSPPVPLRKAPAAACAPGDSAAIDAAIAKYPAAPKEAVSVLRGCFGDYRALIAIRPLEITPETIERVLLVRPNGTTRSGKLKDLSYPLHELLSVIDIDGDGTNEIVVHSYRMSMETYAALRMTDSVSFTRFASGFTIEKR